MNFFFQIQIDIFGIIPLVSIKKNQLEFDENLNLLMGIKLKGK